MAETKREALERFHKALIAHDRGLLTAIELNRIESDVLSVSDVKPQNIRDLKTRFRESLVKNHA